MSTESLRREQHIVSRGYQKNFATIEHRVSVIDARTGRPVDLGRPIKSNFVRRDFVTIVNEDGALDDRYEKEFSRLEQKALTIVRGITPAKAITSAQREALLTVTALHLTRSPAFEQRHQAVVLGWLRSGVSEIAERTARDPVAQLLFERENGRSADPGEIARRAALSAAEMAARPGITFDAMLRGVVGLTAMLSRHSIQLVSAPEPLNGFLLADHPVAHGLADQEPYGFRGGLAVGDADFVALPIGRRLAAFYTHRPLSNMVVKTKRTLDTINAIFAKNAEHEIACHPDDALYAQRLLRSLDRFPLSALWSGRLR